MKQKKIELVARPDINQTYADELIQHAKELFQFADQHRKAYHESIPNAASFYR